MTEKEIQLAIEAGAAKRAERQARREALRREAEKQAEKELDLPSDFANRLKATWNCLEHVYYKREQMTPELMAEVKALFLPDADDEFRYRVYEKFFHDYETLLFYAWVTSPELCDVAFKFWDNVLQHPNASFSGNSVVRILGSRPNENLLKVMQHHHEKFLGGSSVFKVVLGDIIDKYVREPGLWNFETKSFDPWTERERQILIEIQKLF